MPQPELAVVVEIADRWKSASARVGPHRIQPPAAGDGVAGLRRRDALIERGNGDATHDTESNPGQHEAIRQPIVDDHRVALRIAVAWRRSHAAKELVLGERCEQRSRLAVDSERVVDRLDVVVGSDVAVGGRRPARTALPARAQIVVAEAGEVLARTWHRRGCSHRFHTQRSDRIFGRHLICCRHLVCVGRSQHASVSRWSTHLRCHPGQLAQVADELPGDNFRLLDSHRVDGLSGNDFRCARQQTQNEHCSCKAQK